MQELSNPVTDSTAYSNTSHVPDSHTISPTLDADGFAIPAIPAKKTRSPLARRRTITDGRIPPKKRSLKGPTTDPWGRRRHNYGFKSDTNSQLVSDDHAKADISCSMIAGTSSSSVEVVDRAAASDVASSSDLPEDFASSSCAEALLQWWNHENLLKSPQEIHPDGSSNTVVSNGESFTATLAQ